MELVMMLPGAAQHLPSRPGDIVKRNLYIQKVFSTRRVIVQCMAQSSAILHLPGFSVTTSCTLSRARDLRNPKFIEPPLSNCMTQLLPLV